MQPQPIKITNQNNKLDCYGFVQIHFAPPHGTIREHDFQKIYFVRHNQQDIFLQLVDFLRVPFKDVSTVFTVPATGMQADDWRRDWVEKYPQTDDTTEMAIYCYVRIDK